MPLPDDANKNLVPLQHDHQREVKVSLQAVRLQRDGYDVLVDLSEIDGHMCIAVEVIKNDDYLTFWADGYELGSRDADGIMYGMP